MSRTVESIAEYTKKQFTRVIWKCFFVKHLIYFMEFFLFQYTNILNIFKTSIDKFLANLQYEKLLSLTKIILLFLKQKNCYLIDNLDELVENICKLSSIDFARSENQGLAECFMDMCEVILLSDNVNFSIEKVHILPNKLYQKKFDPKLVMKLTKRLFDHSLFETVIF